MRTLFRNLMIVSAIFFTANAFAQPKMDKDTSNRENKTPEERADKRTKEMTELLTLSDDQAKKIYEINLAHIKQMDIYKAEIKIIKEKIKAERESTKKKIDAVLTDEQKQKFEQHLQERAQKKHDHQKDGEPSPKK